MTGIGYGSAVVGSFRLVGSVGCKSDNQKIVFEFHFQFSTHNFLRRATLLKIEVYPDSKAKGKLSPLGKSKDSSAEVQLKGETLQQKDENSYKEVRSNPEIRISSTQGQKQHNISLEHSPGRKVKNPNKEYSAVPPSNLDDTR